MQKTTCVLCIHYRQHFLKRGRHYHPIHLGHCVYPRNKSRLPDAPICSRFCARNS